MTLLTIIAAAARNCGVEEPTTVIGNTDENARRLLAWAKVEGRTLLHRHVWPVIRKEATFDATGVESQGTVASVASGFDYMVPDTFYNRTTQQAVTLLSQEDYQLMKASASTGINEGFFFRGSNLHLYPAPSTGDDHAFEYAWRYYCSEASGTGTSDWAHDTDIGVVDERLMELGITWRFKKSNGLDYGEDYNVYEAEVALAISRADPPPVISTAPRTPYGPFGTIVIPEGNWDL